jgi:hypothetical protein
MTTTFRTGGHYAYVYLWVLDDEGTWSTSDVCYVHIVDLDADVDRNAVINVDDEDHEGADHAIVLPNCDDDDGDGIPDNWPGNNNTYTPPNFDDGDWDLDGTYEDPGPEAPNRIVDNTADISDLAELWFHQMQFRVLPSFKIRLEVTKPSQHNFFSNVQSKDIIRIFLPNQQQGDDWVVTAGAEAVIGPENGATAEFTYENGLLSMFEGYNKVKFRVEGIEFGAMAEITLKFYENDVVQGSDTVKMRVAPFVLTDHTMGVSSSGKTVYVADKGSSNQDLRDELGDEYGSHLDECGWPYNRDIWQQDGYEVGCVEAPYGSMPVFLVSPRAYRDYADLAKYVHNERLLSGVGVCWRLEGEADPDDTYNSFGNVECRPSGGKLFCGQSLHNDIKQFFDGQDVNVNPRLQVNTDWLWVGHVDEVISFASTGGRTVAADPEVCWGLLIWAHSIDPWGAYVKVGKPLYWRQVYYILTDSTLRGYNFDTVMAPQRLPSIRSDLGLASPETVTKRYSGSGELTKGGAFVGFFPNSNKRKYRITFSNSTDYSLQYKELPYGDWIAESDAHSITGSINKDQDCIFKDAKCFILKHWLEGPFQQGDYFEFEADPTCSTIEMPVLFSGGAETAYAYTIDHANCLVDGGTVFTGQTHESSTDDVLKDYVTNMFGKAGYSTITDADSSYYHNGGGDIHCGTNVMR